jgi:hypothetical protein
MITRIVFDDVRVLDLCEDPTLGGQLLFLFFRHPVICDFFPYENLDTPISVCYIAIVVVVRRPYMSVMLPAHFADLAKGAST